MKKLTFGSPESGVPSQFCDNFNFSDGDVKYPVEKIEFYENARGCCLRLPLAADEQIYGLGLQLKCFSLRGRKLTLRPNSDPLAPTGDSHAPVPFFVSTAGYGIYIDTARAAELHIGSKQVLKRSGARYSGSGDVRVSTEELYSNKVKGDSNISIQIPVAKGVDLYIFEGETITDVVSQYNMMSGGGCKVPKWALSAIYRCYGRYSRDEVLKMAKELKYGGYSVGTIGLEPGWMTHAYSDTYVWNTKRFPKPAEMINELRSMGYHVNLWEHSFVHPDSPIYESLLPYAADYEVWDGLVPDFSIEKARSVFADYHKGLVDMGIDGFKLDECDSSDFKDSDWSFPNMANFPSGLDGEQYHALFGVLYMKTILKALDGHPTLSEVRNAGALSSSYPFVLYSDLYDHEDFIRGCATSGFSGILWTPEVRDAKSREEFLRRLQSNVFSVQCLINAWYCEDMPWRELDCENEVKELLNIREQLVPMLCKAFERYSKEGVPPVRALVSDYTLDLNTYDIDDEYIFCDSLIVAPIAAGKKGRKVYLPEGSWRDYFTKEPVKSGWFEVESELIPVYEKSCCQ